MKFTDYTKDERDEWRRQDITRAYLEELTELDAEYGTRSLTDIVAARMHEATVTAGRQEGIMEAIRVLQMEEAP